MVASNSFKILVVACVLVTALPKIIINGGVSNPSNKEILLSIEPFFASQDFKVAGLTEYAGRTALLIQKDACIAYVISVAHQGWNEITLKQALSPGQSLWFQFEGDISKDTQNTYYPLALYYARKSLRYVGINAYFPPMLAIVSDGSCDLQSIHWAELIRIPFNIRRFI